MPFKSHVLKSKKTHYDKVRKCEVYDKVLVFSTYKSLVNFLLVRELKNKYGYTYE